ncbi:MAG TPA: CerR family C-terminal domain-containing protein [Pseudomonadales bacterium]|nr:CerR family C-terminal domain-containing protein [Pseudomonadales bacterium]
MGTRPSSTRGDQTREALIDAAIEIFGRDGFRAASTRSIADAAGVNQALIGYHFGGKPGLYLAAFERITSAVEQHLLPVTQPIEEEFHRGEVDRERGVGYVLTMIDAIVATFTLPESEAWARLILREQQNPSEAFDRLYDRILGRHLTLMTALIASVRRLDPHSTEARLISQTVIGQGLVFRSARATVLRHLGWRELGMGEIASIQSVIRRNVTAMLTGG